MRRFQILLPLFALALFVSGAPDDRRLSVYSNAANYSLPVQQHNGLDYAGLLETLDPLGTVSAKTDHSHWRFRFNDLAGEFVAGKTRGKIRGTDFDLTAPFILDNSRGMVPLSSLSTLLPRILGGPVAYHEASRRLFIGDIAVHFTAQIVKTSPPTLVMNFTSAVNPTIATESGHLRMTFTHEPLVSPGSQALTFDNKAIPSANYQEGNGVAEVVVSGTVPLMASFSNDNRTITIAPPPAAATGTAPQAPAGQAALSNNPSTAAAPSTKPGIHHYFAVIDPSHGGDERGAALNDQIAEKDVTLSFARHLRQELEVRHLTALLLRDSDSTLTLDQRASLANAAHPAIYICIHASSDGPGVRLFTAINQPTPNNRGPFVDWDAAQGAFLAPSRLVATSLGAALQSRQVPARFMPAPLQPLSHINAPAIAIEVSPSTENISQVNSPVYQQALAAVIAGGLEAAQSELEARR